MLHLVPIWETPGIEGGQYQRRTWRYYVVGDSLADNADNYAVSAAFAAANIPPVSDGFQLINLTSAGRTAPGMFIYEAKYGSEGEFRVTNEHQFMFNTTGGSQHITCAISHIKTYDGGPNNPTDQDGAINVDDSGNVAGMDVDVAAFDFQTILYLSPLTVNMSNYLFLLKQLTDTINAADFTISIDDFTHTFAPGEVRLLGAHGALRAYGDYEITLNFSSYPNADGVDYPTLTVGPITGIVKRGWDNLSVQYTKSQDTVNHFLACIPQRIFIDQIYFYQNWAGLIPT